jgi:mono/diheme cytochrome c family protein
MKTLVLALTVLGSTAALAEADAPALWKQHCKGCHGDTGKADTKNGKKFKVEDMTTEDWQKNHKDDEMKKAITEGLPESKEHEFQHKMKSFKDKLKPDEVDALVKHIRTLKK